MPWKFRERPIRKQWHEHVAVRVALALCVGLALIALPTVWTRYQNWLDLRRLGRANSAFARGDFREALLLARALQHRPIAAVAAQDLIKTATEALQSREAMSWQRTRSAIESGDTDHLLGLADAFVTNDDPQSAERVLQHVRPEDRDLARFHRLSARVAAKSGDSAKATQLYEKAVALEPENEAQLLELVELQLASNDPREQALGLSTVDRLKLKPESRLPALRLLLGDANRRQDRARAREVAKIIAGDAGAEFSDQIALLQALHELRPKREEEFNALLSQLQRATLTEPENMFVLLGWMIEHDLALLVLDWTAKLPPELTSGPPVAPAVAQALMRAADWRALRQKVEAESWPDVESMRLGFLSLALGKLGNPIAADATWLQALEATESHPLRLEKLARAAFSWDAKKRAEQALWVLGTSDWCPRWAMDYLWAVSMERGDTARLYEVSKLRLRAQPENIATRNNSLALALLVGQDTTSTLAAAAALHREQPQDAAVGSTYAFSLLLQGQAAEAVKVMESFRPDDRGEASVALYFGSFLAAAGESERAEKYLAAAETAGVLPEERRLREMSLFLARSRAADRAAESTAGAEAWKEALSAAGEQPMLLEHLARTATQWGWPARAEAALLRLAALDRAPEWAREPLWAAVLKTNDSALIQRIGRLLARTDPDDVIARANTALVALLAGREPDTSRAQAEALFKEHPGVPEVAAAYGLARLQAGRAEEAVKAINQLKPEQLSQPRVALYRGIFLAAAGQTVDAEPILKGGVEATQFPEEKVLVRMLELAFETQARDAAADSRGADERWLLALSSADNRPDWLELLAKFATKSTAARHLETVLWKLADQERCPRWVVDQLWANVQQNGTPAQRLKVCRLLVKADARNVPARVDAIVLSLLIGDGADAAARQADALFKQNPTGPGVALAHALALHLQKRPEEALKILEALPPDQLKQPRAAVYHGVCLAANGQIAKAAEAFRLTKGAALLPEEVALVERTLTGQSPVPATEGR